MSPGNLPEEEGYLLPHSTPCHHRNGAANL